MAAPLLPVVDSSRPLLPEPKVPSSALVTQHGTSRFGDMLWDLSPSASYIGPARDKMVINWGMIEQPAWRQVAKEVVWLRLNRRIGRHRRVKPQTALALALRLSRVAGFLNSIGKERPDQVALSDDFLLVEELREQEIGSGTLQHYIRAYALLSQLRNHLSIPLRHEPFRGERAGKVVRAQRDPENRTPVIPPQVMRPLLDGCLHLIATVGERSGELVEAVVAEDGNTGIGRHPIATRERVEHWLERRASLGRGIPVNPSGTFNYSQIKREAAVDVEMARREPWFEDGLRQHVANHGLDVAGEELRPPPFATKYRSKKSVDLLREWADARVAPVPLTGTRSEPRRCPCPLDHPVRWVNCRWVANEAALASGGLFSQDRPTAAHLWEILHDLVHRVGVSIPPGGCAGLEEKDALRHGVIVKPMPSGHPRDVLSHLVAACFVLIAYLTGMRASEVKAIGRGSVSVRRSEDGSIDMHWVESRTFKGNSRPMAGEERRWVAIEPVVSAIEVMENIAATMDPEGFGKPLFQAATLPDRIAEVENEHLNGLRDYLNENAEVFGLGPIPDVDGEPWRFTTRQFRRTLAQHIAAEPFGVVAGAIQYGHIRAATFDGYAGRTYNSFNTEVARAQRRHAAETMVDLFLAHREGDEARGPKSSEIAEWFDEVSAQIEVQFNGLTPSRSELRRLLKSQNTTVYFGLFNLCLFDPSKANCYTADTPLRDRNGPRAGFCDPAGCENSCVAPSQLPRWEGQLKEVEGHLREPGLPRLQRRVFEDTRERILRVVA